MSECYPHLFVKLRDARTRDAWLAAMRDGEPVQDDPAYELFESKVLADDPEIDLCETDGAQGLRLFTMMGSLWGRQAIEELFDEMRALFGSSVEEMTCTMLDDQTGEYTLSRLSGSVLELGTVDTTDDEAYAALQSAEPDQEHELVLSLVKNGAVRLNPVSTLVEDWDV